MVLSLTTPAVAALPWSIRPAQAGDETAILQLLNTVYGYWGNLAYHTWKYTALPASFRLPAWVAVAGGEIIGHYGMLALGAVLSGESVRAAQSVDAGVLPAYRRQGILTAIERAILDQAADSGVKFVYAFPGLQSLRMHDRIGYSPFAYVPEMTCLLRLDQGLLRALQLLPGDFVAVGHLLRHGSRHLSPERIKRLARIRTEWLFFLAWVSAPFHKCPKNDDDRFVTEMPAEHFGPEFDHFWETSLKSPIELQKDRAYLNWRYATRPERKYRVLVVKGTSCIQGYLVMTRRDGQRWEIADLQVLAGEEHIYGMLLRRARNLALQEGGLLMTAWSFPGKPAYQALRQAGFVSQHVLQRWSIIQPWLYRIILYTRHLPEEQQRQIFACARQWPITPGDSDLA